MRLRKAALIALGCVFVGVLLAALAGSPLVLILIDHRITANWSDVGNIGQAYGAISALLSGIAVGGVALSLLMQAHQTRIDQARGMRVSQLELMKVLLEDPSLRPVSPIANAYPGPAWRKSIYLNLMFKYLEMGYEIGYFSETSIRTHTTNYFQIEHAREWWGRARDDYRPDAHSRRLRRFLRIVDEQYAKAVAERAAFGETGEIPDEEVVERVRPSRMSPGGVRVLVVCVSVAAPVVVCLGWRFVSRAGARWRMARGQGRGAN